MFLVLGILGLLVLAYIASCAPANSEQFFWDGNYIFKVEILEVHPGINGVGLKVKILNTDSELYNRVVPIDMGNEALVFSPGDVININCTVYHDQKDTGLIIRNCSFFNKVK